MDLFTRAERIDDWLIENPNIFRGARDLVWQYCDAYVDYSEMVLIRPERIREELVTRPQVVGEYNICLKQNWISFYLSMDQMEAYYTRKLRLRRWWIVFWVAILLFAVFMSLFMWQLLKHRPEKR